MRRGGVLFDGPSIAVPRELARLVGLNEAIVLQQVHYLCWPRKNDTNLRDGKYWVYKSYPDWNKEFHGGEKPQSRQLFVIWKRKGFLFQAFLIKRAWTEPNGIALIMMLWKHFGTLHRTESARWMRQNPTGQYQRVIRIIRMVFLRKNLCRKTRHRWMVPTLILTNL